MKSKNNPVLYKLSSRPVIPVVHSLKPLSVFRRFQASLTSIHRPSSSKGSVTELGTGLDHSNCQKGVFYCLDSFLPRRKVKKKLKTFLHFIFSQSRKILSYFSKHFDVLCDLFTEQTHGNVESICFIQ